MTDSLAQTLIDFFQNKLPEEVIIFLISMLPILELRGGLIAARLLEVPLLTAFPICFLGNILPVPFILLFIRKIFQFLRDKRGFRGIIRKLEIRSMRQSEKVKRWRNWGLLLFVAIPLPGTGGWTGALIAALLDMRLRTSFPIIALGVFLAGVIMSLAAYWVPGLFGFTL